MHVHRIYTSLDGIREATKRIISNRMFVSGWAMRDWLESPETIQYIGIIDVPKEPTNDWNYKIDWEPASVCVHTDRLGVNFAVFTRKRHRRKGYATLLTNKAYEKFNKKLIYTEGNDGSFKFFDQTKLKHKQRRLLYI